MRWCGHPHRPATADDDFLRQPELVLDPRLRTPARLVGESRFLATTPSTVATWRTPAPRHRRRGSARNDQPATVGQHLEYAPAVGCTCAQQGSPVSCRTSKPELDVGSCCAVLHRAEARNADCRADDLPVRMT